MEETYEKVETPTLNESSLLSDKERHIFRVHSLHMQDMKEKQLKHLKWYLTNSFKTHGFQEKGI